MPPAVHAEDEQCLPLPFEPALEGDEDCETGRARLVGHPHDDLLALHSLRTVELAIGGG